MDLTVLKDQIMKKELSNFYVFTGTEIGIQQIYLNQMSKVLGMPIVRADSILSIYDKCTSNSLFGSSTNFYVIRNDTDFMKQEKVYTTIKTDIKSNVIVLLYEKLDSRLKFSKFFSDCTVPFEKLAHNVLVSYIKKQGLSSRRAEELSNKVSGCYDMAMLECDKINQYAEAKKIDVDRAMVELLESGIIYQPEESDVFTFTEAVMNRQGKMACKILDILDSNAIPHINILGTLYNTMKAVMLMQCCESSDIASTTGLDKGQIYFNKKYIGNYDTSELIRAVRLLYNVISGIKSGYIDDKVSVLYAIVQII